MAKGKRKSSKGARGKGMPWRVRLLVGLLVVVVAAGIGAIKFAQTPRGHIMLLDAGFSDYYSLVQEELETGLRFALRSLELQFDLDIDVEREQVAGETLLVRHWRTTCRGDCSPVRIGLEFTRAARDLGARVESRVTPLPAGDEAGEVVSIVVGSRRFPTHRIEVTCLEAVEPQPVPEPRPKLALVIDDFGYSRSHIVEAFLTIDLPLTIAVIPTLPQTSYAIEQARINNKQAILHVPMEAESYASDVPTLSTGMSDEEIRDLLTKYLEGAPGVIGINNHMGSLATQDARIMQVVSEELRDRNLFFFDSLTSPKSVAYNTAKRLSVPTVKNDLFLDAGTKDDRVVEERLLRLLELARRKGSAVGIGHPRSWTWNAIKRNEELLKTSGVDLVFVSELME